jgi:glycosyltransferase involved in cell wall biosynthesis
MKKLVFLQPVLAHYRQSVFNIIETWPDYEVMFVAGSDYLDIKIASLNNPILLPYFKFSFFGHRFYYLRKSFRVISKLKPDIIISSGVDFHLLHTIPIYLYFRFICGIKFIWWTQATHGKQGALGVRLRKFFYKSSAGLLTYSESGKLTLLNWGISPDRIEVIRNAIHTEDYGFLSQSDSVNAETENFTIVFSGRINKDRRLEILFKALLRYKENYHASFSLIIVGGGYIKDYQKLISELNLEQYVTFTGPKFGSDAAGYLQNADLMVYPKAIGLAILHAYSFGIPIITSNDLKKQMPEIELLVPGETGDFYQDNDPEDLAEKIAEWKEHIRSSKQKIKKACIQRIMDLEYLPDKVADKIHRFISKY